MRSNCKEAKGVIDNSMDDSTPSQGDSLNELFFEFSCMVPIKDAKAVTAEPPIND